MVKPAVPRGRGRLGAVARYAVSDVIKRATGAGFPWGTITVNLCGCLLFGLIWTLCAERHLISERMRWILLTGFLGAFTTFSTYAFETEEMLRQGQAPAAFANILIQNVFGIAAITLGSWLARWW